VLASSDVSAVPILRLIPRKLRFGPFGSGRDLVKFLCTATVGAAVAAVTSAAVWPIFLGVGILIALPRVEGQTLDDFAVGYCRFRWRSAVGSQSLPKSPGPAPSRSKTPGKATASLCSGGIPIAYLPPQEMQRLFEGYRAALGSVDGPVAFRAGGERFSPLPFLPATQSLAAREQAVLDSYRDLVRTLLRNRFRRRVDLTLWNDPAGGSSNEIALKAQLDELWEALGRLGISTRRAGAPTGGSSPGDGSCR
jgi:hypothetical protein